MFPVNVRFKNNTFYYKGVKYNMPKMGIIKDSPGNLVFKTKDELILKFSPNQITLSENYPFLYELTVRYRLIGSKVLNEFVIKNNGDEKIYFALGGHPGFNCWLNEGRTRKTMLYLFLRRQTYNDIL